MKKHLLFIFAALLPLLASAQTEVEIDGIWYNLVSKAKLAEVKSSGGTKYSGTITIPATVTYEGEAYSVTSIGSSAFSGCSSLTAVHIPASVTSIGSSAFYGCSSLTAVHISSIEAWCKITFENYESNPLYHAHNLYLNGELVTNLVIPDGVTSIGNYAFLDCSSLTAITIPEGVTSIGDYAFRDCSSLTAITFPENSQLTSIGEYAFSACSILTAITIPEGVTSIGYYAFNGCRSLTAITIPEGVTSIEYHAFYGCSILTAINIPEGVTSIGQAAFYGCSSLTAINIPESVKSIDQGAFANCSELTDVYCNAETVPSTEADAFDGSYIEYATLHVPTNAVASYKTTAPWSSFGTIVSLDAAITRIILSASSATLTEGESLTLTATVVPNDASITWNSSDATIATVDNTGKVKAVAPGTATITAKANDGSGVSASCKIKVINQPEGQFKKGDTFKYTNSEGVVKTYKIVGENLIENPSFDNGTTGWTGGAGGALSNTEVHYNGGVDGGAYIRPISNTGKSNDGSIGTAWDVEVGKTYVFNFFIKNQSNTAAEYPAGGGYIKVSMSNTYCDETLVLQPLPHVDADLAWTQNTYVVTAEYTSLALCARWLDGATCFDSFILAEVEEVADTKELEDLLAQCAEWMDYFGDDAKEYDTFNAVVEKGQALVDGGEFTAADLNAMVHELKEALLDFRVVNANDENPVDVTDRYIKNTKFDNSWTGWTVVNAAVHNGMNIRNFAYFEPGLNPVAEINGVPSAESSISQTVYNLPMGYYRFTVQAVMSHSVDVYDPEAKSGAIIFCNGSELDMVTKEQTAGGAANDASYPETFTIEGEVSADSMVVGFKGLTSASFSYVAIDNVRLYYIGESHSTITYIVDGKLYHQESIKHGSTITPIESPSKEGYTFSGWSEVPEIMPTHDITVNATFTINSYNVTFKIGDEIISSETLEYGAAVVAPEAPTKEGHTFAGWGDIAETVPASDVTYEGSYTVNNYTVTFKIDDEVIISEKLPYGAEITAPEVSEKEGHTFSGWGEIPETMPAHEVVVNGYFVPNNYLVTFMLDGVVISSESLEYGSTITAPNAPEREGYTFNGWGEVAATVPVGDVTYEGSYSVNSYLLTFVVDGEIMETESVPYGTAIVAPEPPVKEGHTFSGWSEVPETMPPHDVTLNGTFTVNKYLVTFTVDGAVIASDSLEYGTAITVPTMPEREGYTFSGWSEVAETVPAHDVTYDASYTANIYKVYYFVGATLVHTAEVAYGEAIPEYVYEPTAEGDVFVGWVGETYETMPAHDVTYTANIESGINQLLLDNGQLTIYDLMGRKVTDIENLKGGVYIINGRKVFIK